MSDQKRTYYVGETPPPLTVEYRKSGVLSNDIDGAAVVAKVKIVPAEGGAATTEEDVPCSAVSGGIFTVNFPTPSIFTKAGVMQIDCQVTQGAYVWFLPRLYRDVKART